MKVAVISTNEGALKKLYHFATSERNGFFSETRYILINLKKGFTSDAAELIKKETDSITSYELLVLTDLDTDRELAALLAAYLEAGCLTSCSDISLQDGTPKIKKEVYGGLAHLNLSVKEFPLVITLSDALLDVDKGDAADFSPDVLNVETTVTRSKILSVNKIEKTVDLPSAKIIVSCGRGLKDKKDVELIEKLAKSLHPDAELGCSRPLSEDFRWLPLERQVGLTGVTVKPDLYIAVGISGQVQHLVGMRDSKVVVAINNNKSAPIFEFADYGVVGDLYEVVPALLKRVGG